jgi:hypothetical protein
LIFVSYGPASAIGKGRAIEVGEVTSPGAAPERWDVSIDPNLPPAGQWDKAASQRHGDEDMRESEWRDWVRQYLGGLEAQIAAFRSLETRVDALERKRREHEVRLRVGRPWEA